jgi:single-strand DNA-binding protein
MLNKWIGIGRLTRDPDQRFTPNGNAVTNFTLAVPRQYDKEKTDFIDCQAWRKTAELCAQYLTKGSLCAVEGRLEIQNYEAQDGSKRKAARVVVDQVQFLSPKGQERPQETEDEYEGESIPF